MACLQGSYLYPEPLLYRGSLLFTSYSLRPGYPHKLPSGGFSFLFSQTSVPRAWRYNRNLIICFSFRLPKEVSFQFTYLNSLTHIFYFIETYSQTFPPSLHIAFSQFPSLDFIVHHYNRSSAALMSVSFFLLLSPGYTLFSIYFTSAPE